MSSFSLMRLEACNLAVLHIDACPDAEVAKDSKVQITVNVSYHVKEHTDLPKYLVDATFIVTTTEGEVAPFRRIEIGLRGVFAFPADTDKETISKYVPTLCLSSLYGMARGMVSQATGTCNGGAILLPLLDMNEDVCEEMEKKAVSSTPPGKRTRVKN
jgi:preprotein translocase subunit SecB